MLVKCGVNIDSRWGKEQYLLHNAATNSSIQKSTTKYKEWRSFFSNSAAIRNSRYLFLLNINLTLVLSFFKADGAVYLSF